MVSLKSRSTKNRTSAGQAFTLKAITRIQGLQHKYTTMNAKNKYNDSVLVKIKANKDPVKG